MKAQFGERVRRDGSERRHIERCGIGGDVGLVDCPLQARHIGEIAELARRRVRRQECRVVAAVMVDVAVARRIAAHELVRRGVEKRRTD